MELLIVTGMSGAGKTQAANALEDMGYYCVDNVPPTIIPAFLNLSDRSDTLEKMAVVTDVRGGDMFGEIITVLDDLKKRGTDYKILFIDASDSVIIRRYKENRRKHPLCDKKAISISKAVETERQMLSTIRSMADFVVDTTYTSGIQLKEQLADIFLDSEKNGIKILCKSFGFKYGNDAEADIIFDVRCLPNPYYVDDLKNKTGLDEAVRQYVMDSDDSKMFAKKICDFADFSIPLYVKEGKSQLVIAFGCTGGKHRSVTFALMLQSYLTEKGYNVSAIHRDINKNQVN